MNENNPYLELAKEDENPYLQIAKDDTQVNAENSAYIANEKNPDEYAKKVSLAQSFGVKSEFVEQNYDALKKAKDLNDLKTAVLSATPVVKEFASNPENAAVAKDDLEVLKEIEKAKVKHDDGSQAYNAFASGMASVNSMLYKTPQFIGNLSLIPANIIRKMTGQEQVSYGTENALTERYDRAASEYSKLAPDLNRSVTDEISKGNYAQAAEVLGLQFLKNAPMQVALIGSAISGYGTAGLIGAGLGSGAEKASELQKQGIEPLAATAVGAATGSIEAAFESLGTFGLLKTWESSIAKEFGKQSFKEFTFNFGKTLAYSMLGEGNEEFATSLAQDFTDYASGTNPDALKGSWQRALDAGLLGGVSGFGLTAPGGISMGIAKQQQIQQAKVNREFYEALGDKSAESKLRQRLPEKHKEFVERATKDGPVEKIYLNAEGFLTYFQKKDLDPVKVAAELGISKELDSAIENGTDIEIPTAVMANKLAGSEHYNGLSEHVKFSPEQLSQFEIKAQETEAKRALEIEYENAKANKTEDEVKTIEDSAKEVGKNVETQLREIGYSPKAAKTQASLYEEFFRVQGMKSNTAPMDLYSKYGLRINQVNESVAVDDAMTVFNQGVLFAPKRLDDGSYVLGSFPKEISNNRLLNELNQSGAFYGKFKKTGSNVEISELVIPKNKGESVTRDLVSSILNAAASIDASTITIRPESLKRSEADFASIAKKLEVHGFKAKKDSAGVYLEMPIDKSRKTLYKQDAKGEITFGKDRKFNINLFKTKDESTFLHETGHFFLEVMGDLSTTNESIGKDYQTLLDWFGVKSKEEIKTEHHEKFARGFELYLRNGQAPSSKLKKAFHTFRQWLISVYTNAAHLNVEVSPEVRGVFDRMLAADNEIESEKPRALFGDPSSVGMTDEQSLEYLDALAWAGLDARDALQAKLMQDLVRKKDSDYKKRYDAIYESEMTKAKNMTEFKIIEQIKGNLKLSKPVIDKYYSVFKESLPAKSTKVDGGVHPDVVANMYGLENGQAMLQMIAPYRRGVESYVETMTATRIKAEFPELLESPELSEQAVIAAHNSNYKKLKKMELEFLFKNKPKVIKNVAGQLIKRMPTDKQVRAQAVKLIADTSVRDIRPGKFRAAEKRFSNEAAKYFKAGEFDLAFEAKKKELLNFELYDAAIEAREDVAKSIKNFKKLFKSDEDLSKSRDIDLVNASRAILAEFGIMRSEKTAAEYLDKMKTYDPESYAVVSNLVAQATANKGPYQNIKYDYFVEMRDAVMAIYDLAKSRKEIEIDGVAQNVDTVIESLVSRIQELTPKEQKEYEETVTKYGLVKEKLLGAKASLVRAEHWANAMGGNFKRVIFRPISDAVTDYRLKKVDVLKKYEQLLTGYGKGLSADTIAAPELGFMFKNKAELIMTVLHSGNESNLRKLLLGRKWATLNDDGSVNTSKWNKFVKRLQDDGTLTKKDYDFAQGIWDLLETMKPDAQKAHKKMFGYYFNEITANEISTPWGTYRGGYIPAKADVHSVEDAAIRQERESFESQNNSYQFPTTGRGFTKSRVDSYTAPLSLDINLLGGHIDGVLRFTYIEPRVKQMARIVTDKGFRAELAKLDTNIAKDMLVPWLQRTAQQKVMLPSQDGLGRVTDAVAKTLRKNVATQIMFGGVTNTLQQFTGLVVAMSKVKPRHIRNSLWNYVTDNKAMIASMNEKSKWIQSTQGSNINDIHSSINEILLNPSTFDKIQNFSRKHTYFLQSAAQNMVNSIVWAGAYDQAIESGSTELDAIKEADSAVRTTQGTNNPEDISRFEQGTATELLFKQFVGYFNMLANLNSSELVKISREVGLKKGAGRAFYLYLTAFMLPAVLSDIIVRAMAGKFDDDDDDEYLDDVMRSFFGSQFKTVAATVPYAGQVAVAAYNKAFTDSPADDRLSLSPAISILESTAGVGIDVYKDISERGELRKKTVKDALQFVGIMTGIPTGPIGKPVGYLMDVDSGKAKPSGPVDFTRGLVTGRPGAN